MSARQARTVFEQVYDIDLFGPGAAKGFRSEPQTSLTCTHRARCISSRQEDDNTLLNYLNDAFEASFPSKACKWVLIVLANHANEKGECWPSVARICRHTGLKERGVQGALKELNEKGFIEISRKIGSRNRYLIKMTPAPSAPPPPHPLRETPAASAPKPSYNHHNKQTPIVPLQTKSQKSQGSLFPNHSFQENMVLKIYEAYPKKISKPPWHRIHALKAIKDALREIKPEKLLKLTEEYAEVREAQEDKFTPYAAKWFREKRYDADPEDWKDKFGKDEEEEKTLADKISEEQAIKADARAKEVENMWANPPADWGVK